MKYLFIVSIISSLFFACGESSQTENTEMKSLASIELISVVDYGGMADAEIAHTLLDVRTPSEWEKGVIPGAKKMNFFDKNFKDQAEMLDKELPVIVYCYSGKRSGKAAKVLKSMGFSKIYDLNGGWEAHYANNN